MLDINALSWDYHYNVTLFLLFSHSHGTQHKSKHTTIQRSELKTYVRPEIRTYGLRHRKQTKLGFLADKQQSDLRCCTDERIKFI